MTDVRDRVADDDEALEHDKGLLDLRYLVAFFGLLVLFFIAVTMVVLPFRFEPWRDLVREQVAVTLGLPMAATLSLLIVTLFRSTDGQVKFDVLGMKFEGASGPIVMWVFCFVAIACSIKLLWA